MIPTEVRDGKTYTNIENLREWDKNPRGIKREDLDRLKKQLQRLGQYKPLLITSEGEVIGGNMRLRALKELHESYIWISIVETPTDAKKLQYALSDNDRAGYYTEAELFNLVMPVSADFDINEYKIDIRNPISIAEFLSGQREIHQDEFDAEIAYNQIEEPITREKECWQLGEHKLICADSTDKESYIKLMQEEKADLIFTDPPYNVGYDYTVTYREGRARHTGWPARFNDARSEEEFREFINKVFLNCYEFSKDNASFYCWHATAQDKPVKDGIEQAKFRISQTIYWLKNAPTFSKGLDYLWITEPCYFGWKKGNAHFINRAMTSVMKNMVFPDNIYEFEDYLEVIYAKRDKISEYNHPTQRPLKTCERAIKKHSPEGGIIIDAFGGSGSTLLACEQLNRMARLIELDPKYCDVIIQRWEKFTGKKAVKIA